MATIYIFFKLCFVSKAVSALYTARSQMEAPILCLCTLGLSVSGVDRCTGVGLVARRLPRRLGERLSWGGDAAQARPQTAISAKQNTHVSYSITMHPPPFFFFFLVTTYVGPFLPSLRNDEMVLAVQFFENGRVALQLVTLYVHRRGDMTACESSTRERGRKIG